MVLIYKLYLHLSRRERFPFDFFALIPGLVIEGKSFYLNLLFVRLNVFVPLWLPCFMYLFLNRRDLKNYFISNENTLKSVGFGIFLGLCLGVFVNTFYNIHYNNSSLLVQVYELSVAFSEELLFRSILLGILIKYELRPGLAILIQSTVFMLGHLSYFYESQWVALIGVALLGILSGWLTLRYRNVIGAVGLHSVYNLYFL